jgi:signal peptidase II
VKRWQSLIYALDIGLTIILLDRITKAWALSLDRDQVVTSFFSYSLAFNRGISCGYFADVGTAGSYFLIFIISLVICSVFAALLIRWNQRQSIVAEMMVFAGAISNLMDRYMYGAVIDFMLIHYRGWEFPIFNVADMMIVLGVLMFVIRDFTTK